MKKLFIILSICIVSVFAGCAASDDDTVADNENKNDQESANDSESEQIDENKTDDVGNEAESDENYQADNEHSDNEHSDNEQENNLEDVQQLFSIDKIDSITINWKSPSMAGFEKVIIVKNMDRYPEDINDGSKVYEAIGEGYVDSAVESGKDHYYKVFACYGELGCSKGVLLLGRPCFSQMDIVFVMDVSTTMKEMLANLENEIGLVWEFTEKNFSGSPHFGLTVFVDDVTVDNEGNPFDSKDVIKAEFNKWGKFTSTNKQTQSTEANGDWPENSLDALALTAKNYKWRDAADTLKMIILATDDTFYENPKSFSSGIAVEHTYDQTVALLVDGKIRVGAFAAKKGGPTGNADVQPGFFTMYNGKDSIPYATGGEVYFIDDVQTGTIHIYETVKTFIENSMCKTYDDK